MKIINPVYRHETRAGARSFKLPLIVLAFNGVLAAVALLNMYTMIIRVKLTAELQYSSFLGLYAFVAAVEFALLLLFIPAMTAGSISGERDRQTLDLMLTTRLTRSDIVFGKLASNLSTVFLLIVSSFPILGLVFIYGGVTMADVGLVLLCYVVTAVLAGSIGIFCSAAARRTTMATIASYCIVAALTAGTVGINYLSVRFLDMTTVSGASGKSGLLYLLLGSPAVTFLSVMERQAGGGNILAALVPQLEWAREAGVMTEYWWIFSMAVQLFLAAFFLWGAVKSMNPRRRRRRRL